jgi:hypothetical protein
MSGSGSRIAYTRTTFTHRSTDLRGWLAGIAAAIAFAAVPGPAFLMRFALPIVPEAQLMTD